MNSAGWRMLSPTKGAATSQLRSMLRYQDSPPRKPVRGEGSGQGVELRLIQPDGCDAGIDHAGEERPAACELPAMLRRGAARGGVHQPAQPGAHVVVELPLGDARLLEVEHVVVVTEEAADPFRMVE